MRRASEHLTHADVWEISMLTMQGKIKKSAIDTVNQSTS